MIFKYIFQRFFRICALIFFSHYQIMSISDDKLATRFDQCVHELTEIYTNPSNVNKCKNELGSYSIIRNDSEI